MCLLLQQGRRGFLLLVREAAFCIQAFTWLDKAHHIHQLGRAVSFIPSTDLNVNLTQKQPHRHIQNNVAQSGWHMKLITTHCLHRGPRPFTWQSATCISWLPIHSFIRSFTPQVHVQRKLKWRTFSKMFTVAGHLCVVGFQVGTGISSLQLSSVSIYALLFK